MSYLELGISQFVEVPALLEAVDQLPGGLDGAAQQLTEHSAGVLRSVLVDDQRPVGQG